VAAAGPAAGLRACWPPLAERPLRVGWMVRSAVVLEVVPAVGAAVARWVAGD
jgi:hypothetical protein